MFGETSLALALGQRIRRGRHDVDFVVVYTLSANRAPGAKSDAHDCLVQQLSSLYFIDRSVASCRVAVE